MRILLDTNVVLDALLRRPPWHADAAAIAAAVDAIVTRDPAGFSASPVTVLTPERLLALLGA